MSIEKSSWNLQEESIVCFYSNISIAYIFDLMLLLDSCIENVYNYKWPQEENPFKGSDSLKK